jgi:cell division protein FtsN
MAKDYKHRATSREANNRKHNRQEPDKFGVVKWMLITALIISFVVFLVYLKSPGFNKQGLADSPSAGTEGKKISPEPGKPTNIAQQGEEQKPQPPQFDFYTILPKKEVVVPEYEVKTRTREEQVGKDKKTSYILQAGSYSDFKEADRIKAKLALMGIESKIQKAKVESVTWYRIKIGPYRQLSSVNTIKDRLQKFGMKPVVTEVDG